MVLPGSEDKDQSSISTDVAGICRVENQRGGSYEEKAPDNCSGVFLSLSMKTKSLPWCAAACCVSTSSGKEQPGLAVS